ncbi:NPCBM/NEW2 domain-containing protein [Candidatus Phyllobacterium onerii]|uniref:NPCBM/NEW2 domain-containing protein n=1 Tax=Candidatus Phyllobacterium onerii TaxID=3020828 RepID=UPI00232DF90F|nr:NPCBM/NEW2 domain-containing protein [Phyllobacterium sp. IY22]
MKYLRMFFTTALVCLAACNGSDHSPKQTSEATFPDPAMIWADAEAAKAKAVLTDELNKLKGEISSAQANLDRLKGEGRVSSAAIVEAERKLEVTKSSFAQLARNTAAALEKQGRLADAATLLEVAGLSEEGATMRAKIAPVVAAPYEPFPTLYKVRFPDGTKALPAPKIPPMGWNAWNTFQCNVSETMILEIADTIVKNGMANAGYNYINLDDCWEGKSRDKNGKPTTNDKFPSGIKSLAEKIHAKGLKIGIYTSFGAVTCQNYFGSAGYEEIDAKTYAEWGIDYVKYDDCSGPKDHARAAIMRDALARTGRNMSYSIHIFDTESNYDEKGDRPQLDIPGLAHMSRVADDVTDVFDNRRSDHQSPELKSVMRVLELGAAVAGYATPGFWNDFDMLEVGKLPQPEENKTHFAMWAMMASPLLAGNDIRTQTPETLKTLTNKDIIAVNQDPLNIQAVQVREDTAGLQVWNKPLVAMGERAVALLNRSAQPAKITVAWTDLGLEAGPAKLRDLSSQKDLGTFDKEYSATIPSHGVLVLKVQGKEFAFPKGESALSDRPWVYHINGWGPAERNMSNGEDKAGDGSRLNVGGTEFAKGFGVASRSHLYFRPGGKCTQLSVSVGVDKQYFSKPPSDRKGYGNVAFEIWGDGNLLANSGVMTPNDQSKLLKVDLREVQTLRLFVKPGDDYKSFDYADWVNPVIECQ